MNKRSLIIIVLTLLCHSVKGQVSYPAIGKKIPDFFLVNAGNTRIKRISPASLKGRFYILDFFSLGCSACFARFPQIDIVERKFRDSVSILGVGQDYGPIREVFKDYQEQYSLGLQSFYTTKLFSRFKIFGVPYVLWVDDKGVVVAVSTNEEITEENIRRFIHKIPFPFYNKSYAAEVIRDKTKIEIPMFIGGNGGNDTAFMFRSLISKAKPSDAQKFPATIDGALKSTFALSGKKAYQAFSISLAGLYRLAYAGRYSWGMITSDDMDSTLATIFPNPVLLTKDSLLFNTDLSTGEGFYNYSMIIPSEDATPKRVKNIIQNDLKSYFGFDVSIEMRKFQYYAIVIDSTTLDRLRTRGARTESSYSYSHLRVINQTIEEGLEYTLKAAFGYQYLIYNKTPSEERIDFDGEFNATDFEKARIILNSQGIHLLPRDTFIKAIVIRDSVD